VAQHLDPPSWSCYICLPASQHLGVLLALLGILLGLLLGLYDLSGLTRERWRPVYTGDKIVKVGTPHAATLRQAGSERATRASLGRARRSVDLVQTLAQLVARLETEALEAAKALGAVFPLRGQRAEDGWLEDLLTWLFLYKACSRPCLSVCASAVKPPIRELPHLRMRSFLAHH
jgi:hypothetical protein